MAMTLGLLVHVSAGAIGLVSGATALWARKGLPLHRQAGAVFFASMTIMAVSGAYLAFQASVFITVLAGSLTLYLVASSWLTVRRTEGRTGHLEVATLLLGVTVAAFGAALCWRAVDGVTDRLGDFSVPAEIYFIFTAIALLGVATDIRVLLCRGIAGRQRIQRHLWRMCVPLYIAASSFFSGQQQVFPEAIQGTIYLSLPEYAVLLALAFWLGKTWLARPNSARVGEPSGVPR